MSLRLSEICVSQPCSPRVSVTGGEVGRVPALTGRVGEVIGGFPFQGAKGAFSCFCGKLLLENLMKGVYRILTPFAPFAPCPIQ